MADVFDEPCDRLEHDHLSALLARPELWVLAAWSDGALVGGLTAHTLPMTRRATSEIFVFDVAVRADRQRTGVGRRLMTTLREAAASEGIDTVFVAADDEDLHALDFYRALGGDALPATIFTFS